MLICIIVCILLMTGCNAANANVSQSENSFETTMEIQSENAQNTSVSNPSLSLYSSDPLEIYSDDKLIGEYEDEELKSNYFSALYPYSVSADDVVPKVLVNFPDGVLSEDKKLIIKNMEGENGAMDLDAPLDGKYYSYYAEAVKEISADNKGNFIITENEGEFELTTSCTSEEDSSTGKMYIIMGTEENFGDIEISALTDTLSIKGDNISGCTIEIYDDTNSKYGYYIIPDNTTEYNTENEEPVTEMTYDDIKELITSAEVSTEVSE